MLSLKYILFHKKQSLYVFLSIVAASMILVAVNVALATDNKISLEQARDFYGDYHYIYNIQENLFSLLEKLDFGFRNLTLSSIFHDREKGDSGKIQVYFMEWLAGSGIARMLGNIAVALFAMVIVYSVFRISIQQRLSEYGNLEAIGFTTREIVKILGKELLILFVLAVPIGGILGVLVIKGIYMYYSSVGSLDFPAEYLQVIPKDIGWSAFLLLLSWIVILFFTMRFLHKVSVIDLMKGKLRQKRRVRPCRSWSKKTTHMMPVVLIKYFFEKKGRVAAMILMLSLGGTAFLTSSYVEEEIDRNNILTQRAENGTNADIQIQTETLSLQGIIPEETVEQISKMPEVALAEPVSTYLGAMILDDSQIDKMWLESDYWKYLDDGIKRNIQLFGGSMSEEQGKKVLKTEIYGYDKPMLEELDNYLLEGSVHSVNEENTVILQTILDGVGNNGLKLHAGDKITLRYPRENHGDFWPDGDHNILKMEPKGKYRDYYEEKTFTIGGVVKSAIAKDEYLMEGAPQIIMPNEDFRQIFDVDGYNMVSVQLKSGKQAEQAAKKIRSATKEIERCGVIDYTEDIIRQSEFLEQKMLLVHIVVVLLLVMGLFNIMSSVNYILIERRKEFAVIRAMGITDSRLMQSMVGEGVVYGLLISILMLALSLAIRYPIKYIFDHGLMFINAKLVFDWKLASEMTVLNILFSVMAVILPARMILYAEIKNELQEMG